MRQSRLSRSSQAVATLFIVVVIVGFVAAVIGLARWEPVAVDNESIKPGVQAVGPIIDGSISDRVEAELESHLPFRKVALQVTSALRYLLFRSGNVGVVIGRDGWLYTREEFERHQSDPLTLASRLELIAAARDRLADAGVQLLVAIIPSKARIVTETLPTRWARLGIHPRYGNTLNWLVAHDIPTIDLQRVLGSIPHPFLRTDTHWTPSGARHVAAALAGAVSDLGLIAEARRTSYKTVDAALIEVRGDLSSFVPVGGIASLLGLDAESIQTTTTTQTSASLLGLFDTPQIPVTLVGTSFSADERWNFVGELKRELSLDVLNISAEATGPFVPMINYLNGPVLTEVLPELVIWEIPERYLTLPDIQTPEL